MKLLIVGASGLVGWNLARVAREGGHEVRGTYASHPMPGLDEFHVEDTEAAKLLLDQFQPDALACCSAWSWVDGCQQNPARAHLENAENPRRLAGLCHDRDVQFLYFSTSYVFDGSKGPYDEKAEPRPLSVYGESKLLGERKVLEATQGKGLIARTMGVYGEEPQGKNFVYQVVRTLRAGKTMTIPCDQYGNASHATDVATLSLALLDKQASGIWNIAGPEPGLCRKDFALRIAEAYDLDKALFRFVPTSELGQPAPRPRAGGLIIDRIVSATGHKPSSWHFVPIEKTG